MTDKKKRVGILISGRGSNMLSLIAAAREPDYPAEIACVLSNRPEAEGLFKAAGAGLQTRVVDHRRFKEREAFEAELDAALRSFESRPRRLRRLHAADDAGLRRALAQPHAEHSPLAPTGVSGSPHA